jgi:hypothetical protein
MAPEPHGEQIDFGDGGVRTLAGTGRRRQGGAGLGTDPGRAGTRPAVAATSAKSQPPTRALHLRVGSGCRAGSSGLVGNGGLEGRGVLDGSCSRPDMRRLSGRHLIPADSQFLQGNFCEAISAGLSVCSTRRRRVRGLFETEGRSPRSMPWWLSPAGRWTFDLRC